MLAAGRSTADDSPVFGPRAFSGRLKIVRALPLHVELVMADLRARAFAVDLQEMVDPVGKAKEVLQYSAEAWVVYFEGKPAVLWGVFTDSLMSNEAIIWTVTTNVVEQYPFMFLRGSQEIVKYLLRHYSVLSGKVAADYTRSINWLKWLGFEISPTVLEDGIALKRFERRRDNG